MAPEPPPISGGKGGTHPQGRASDFTKLAVADYLVQGDKNEVPPADPSLVNQWRQRWYAIYDRDSDDDINPTDEQLTVLHWRLKTGGTLYADFALWTPVNDPLVHRRKFNTFRQTEVGTWEKIESTQS